MFSTYNTTTQDIDKTVVNKLKAPTSNTKFKIYKSEFKIAKLVIT